MTPAEGWKTFVEGEGIRVTALFTNSETGAPENPNEPVTLYARPPAGAVREVVMTPRGGGRYTANVIGDVVGTWAWRAVSSSPEPGVAQGRFEVEPSVLS